jgi:hypothetical protein
MLNNGAASASVSVPQGSHTINVQIGLLSDATFDIAGTLTLNTGMANSSGKDITKTGNGTLAINGTQFHSAGAVLNANGGTTTILSNANGNLTVNVNATTNFAATQNLAALNVASGKTATLTQNGNKVINTATLSISAGKLNLGNNDMVVRAGALGSWNGSAYTGITGLVQSGLGNGSWNGNGLVTTMSDATTSVRTTLAVVQASDALGITPAQSAMWSGQLVAGGAILVMYSWGGDADVNGVLNGDDYFHIDSNVLNSGSVFGYHNGDFNLDGEINGDDYFIIDSNFSFAQNAPPMMGSGAAIISVPEPGALMFLSAGVILARRRRQKMSGGTPGDDRRISSTA